MKKLKNIIWLILLLIIIYLILIFIKPVISNNIAEKIGLTNFNEKIRSIKKGIDIFSTKIPTKKELEETYSGAKNKVEEIKGNIDDIRKTADNLSEKYNNAKEFINNTGEKINSVKNSINDLQKIGKDITNVVNKEAIK